MTQQKSAETYDNPVTVKWIKVIALWSLTTAVINLLFYGLGQLTFIEGSFTLPEHLDLIANSLLGLLTFWGLWRHAPWGWKVAVVTIPLSWLYGVYGISRHYQPGMGVVTSAFLFIDAAIYIFLFTPAVVGLFRIKSFWLSLVWVKYPLLVTAVFLLTLDFAGNLGAVISAFLFFAAMMFWNFYRQNKPDNLD